MNLRAPLFALALSLPATAAAQERPNAVSVSPLLGLLGLARINVGAWAINYERRLGPHLGVLVEASGVHVHGPPMHVWLFGGTVGARWHFFPEATGPFVGVQAGYRTGWGRSATTVTVNGVPRAVEEPSLTPSQIVVVANAGYRWVHTSGLTVTGRLGAGWGPFTTTAAGTSLESGQIAQNTNDVLGFTSVAVDTELSVGYAF
jgi:hypothetical protein